MSQNKVTFGLSNAHVAFEDQTSPELTWKTPRKIPGNVRFTPTAVGDSSTFYADNLPYFSITANNGYTAEWEVANMPDDVLAEMLGWEVDDNGMLVEVADAIPKPFALLGEIEGDKRKRRFVYYQCVASRPAKERTTKNESITPATDVLNLTISPVEIADKVIVKGDLELSDSNATAFNSFFTSVYTPVFTSGGE